MLIIYRHTRAAKDGPDELAHTWTRDIARIYFRRVELASRATPVSGRKGTKGRRERAEPFQPFHGSRKSRWKSRNPSRIAELNPVRVCRARADQSSGTAFQRLGTANAARRSRSRIVPGATRAVVASTAANEVRMRQRVGRDGRLTGTRREPARCQTPHTLILIEAGVEQAVAVRVARGEVHRGSLRRREHPGPDVRLALAPRSLRHIASRRRRSATLLRRYERACRERARACVLGISPMCVCGCAY